MSAATNKHWIGPRVGTRVTVLFAIDRIQEHARLYRATIEGQYRARIKDEAMWPYSVDLDPLGEAITWCFDWEGEEVDALRAAAAMA